MAMSGLAKLPVINGLIYRGTGEARDKIAKAGDVINVTAIQSWSQRKETAESFTGGGEVRVVYKMNTTRARNIVPLKGPEAEGLEPEWVLMPGNSYQVDSVEPGSRFFNYKVTMVHCTELS